MIASSSSRNNSKNMLRFSSNDRNSITSVTTSARIQTTTDDSKPKPRSNNQTSRSLPVSESRISVCCRRWIPIGKLFDSCTSNVDSELPHGSNVDIPNIHECKQTLDVSAYTSINVSEGTKLDLSAGTLCNVKRDDRRVMVAEKAVISKKPLFNVDSQ
ncbi:hypothetical protein Tco_0032380 [Tanacetum coccineum]